MYDENTKDFFQKKIIDYIASNSVILSGQFGGMHIAYATELETDSMTDSATETVINPETGPATDAENEPETELETDPATEATEDTEKSQDSEVDLEETPEMPVAEEPVHAEEPVLSEPPKAEADPIPEIAGPENVISPAAVVDPGPGVYDVADSNLILDVSGSSTNDHTQALMAWYDEDGNFYIAVQSTHKLEGTMTIDGITSTDVHVYDAPITTYPIDVEGVTYNTRDLLVNGNTQDTSWTVYMFADAKFSAGTYTFSITGIGGGHDVNNRILTISVPKIDIHVKKVGLIILVNLEQRISLKIFNVNYIDDLL